MTRWERFKLTMITSTVIKLIGFAAIAIELVFYFLLTELIGDLFYIADTIGFVIVGTSVFMVVATIYAHVSYAFCCWFWQTIMNIVSLKEPE